ncbi:MAG TPA: 4-hydroxybenzoate 3-monooxygenase [Caulobacteraceae bacterium]|nr:4-hydroxybenzoate 3-monooxygenase [Caulobacteraceae bacterium]
MRTQVAIIGAGPAGLLLSQLLSRAGIDCIVLEQRDQAYVESRIRAGLLERFTVELLGRAGVDARLQREALVHDGFSLAFNGAPLRIDLRGLAGASVVIYGQSEVTRDLIAAAGERGVPVVFEAADVALHGISGADPFVTYRRDGEELRVDCEFVAGCDGFHGVSRQSIPPASRREFERVYPFGWLGILADVPPCSDELLYAHHERGFALATMRSRVRSRYYVQCALDDTPDDWPDARVWDELEARLGPAAAGAITRGPSIEKSIAPLRSFVAEPLRYGRLFLAGDAAHIVPPTGAKGLNLAAADVHFLSEALARWYRDGDADALDRYSGRALARVWKAERFSWWFTGLTHRFDEADAFSRRLQEAELDYLAASRAAQAALAENYVGLPIDGV